MHWPNCGFVCLECLTEEERQNTDLLHGDARRRLEAVGYQNDALFDFHWESEHLGVQGSPNARKPGVGSVRSPDTAMRGVQRDGIA